MFASSSIARNHGKNGVRPACDPPDRAIYDEVTTGMFAGKKLDGSRPADGFHPQSCRSGVPWRTIITGRPLDVWYSFVVSIPSDL